MNPIVAVFWFFSFLLGLLIGDIRGGLVGITAAVGLSLFLHITRLKDINE